jgi:hypothetical protein
MDGYFGEGLSWKLLVWLYELCGSLVFLQKRCFIVCSLFGVMPGIWRQRPVDNRRSWNGSRLVYSPSGLSFVADLLTKHAVDGVPHDKTFK